MPISIITPAYMRGKNKNLSARDSRLAAKTMRRCVEGKMKKGQKMKSVWGGCLRGVNAAMKRRRAKRGRTP